MMTDVGVEGNVVACSTEEIFREKSKKKSLLKLLEFRGATKQEIQKMLDKYTQLYNDTESVDINSISQTEEKQQQNNWKKLFQAPPQAPVNPTSPLSTAMPEPKQQSAPAPPAPPTASASIYNYFSSFNAPKK